MPMLDTYGVQCRSGCYAGQIFSSCFSFDSSIILLSPYERAMGSRYPSSRYYRSYRSLFSSMPMHCRGDGLTSRSRSQDGEFCILVPICMWIFASVTLIIVFYGSKTSQLGPNTSWLLRTNSLFVSQIQVEDGEQEGPILYGFSERPNLSLVKNWTDRRKTTLQASYHEEWQFWLNKGSHVRLTYRLLSKDFLDILIAVLRGKQSYLDWLADPTDPSAAIELQMIHGVGKMEFKVDADDTYILAIGNLNLKDVEVELYFNISSTAYDIQSATHRCSLSNRFCGVKLMFPGCYSYLVLTTPDVKLGLPNIYTVKFSYGPRWSTYCIILGSILCLVLIVTNLINQENSNPEQVPLLRNEENVTKNYGSVSRYEADTQDVDKDHEIYNENICAICYDRPRASFFDPCGHSVACYNCGIRIQREESADAGHVGSCPICRGEIKKVRRIYTC